MIKFNYFLAIAYYFVSCNSLKLASLPILNFFSIFQYFDIRI